MIKREAQGQNTVQHLKVQAMGNLALAAAKRPALKMKVVENKKSKKSLTKKTNAVEYTGSTERKFRLFKSLNRNNLCGYVLD